MSGRPGRGLSVADPAHSAPTCCGIIMGARDAVRDAVDDPDAHLDSDEHDNAEDSRDQWRCPGA